MSRDLDMPDNIAELSDVTQRPIEMTSHGIKQAGGKLSKAMKHLEEKERRKAKKSMPQLQQVPSELAKLRQLNLQ